MAYRKRGQRGVWAKSRNCSPIYRVQTPVFGLRSIAYTQCRVKSSSLARDHVPMTSPAA